MDKIDLVGLDQSFFTHIYYYYYYYYYYFIECILAMLLTKGFVDV